MQADGYANLHNRADSAAEKIACPQAFRDTIHNLTMLSDCRHIETVHDADRMGEFKKPDSGLMRIAITERWSFAYHTTAT